MGTLSGGTEGPLILPPPAKLAAPAVLRGLSSPVCEFLYHCCTGANCPVGPITPNGLPSCINCQGERPPPNPPPVLLKLAWVRIGVCGTKVDNEGLPNAAAEGNSGRRICIGVLASGCLRVNCRPNSKLLR